MGWFDDIVRNLAEAADPAKNLKALFGIMPEEDMTMPNGAPVNIGMPSGGGRAIGQAGRALVPSSRALVGAGRGVVPRAGRRAAGAIDDGMGVDVLWTRGSGRGLPGGGRQAGGGRPAVSGRGSRYSPRTSSNTATQLTDDALRMSKGKKAAIAGLLGAGAYGALDGVRGMMGGGRQEGTGPQGQVVEPIGDTGDIGQINESPLDDGRGAAGQAQGVDPFGAVNDRFDRWGGMIDEMQGVYDNLAQTNMGTIADIFGESQGVARGAIGPMGETYGQGAGDIQDIYAALDDRLGGLSGELQGIASGAAGSAAGDVATTAEAAIAPFEAASASASAAAQANMAQRSNAGQGYLANLADASVEEGKMHAGRVQAAADARKAEFDIKRMELEMAREEALAEIASDAAGSAAEREAMAALFGEAGVPLPEGLDMKGAQSYLNLGQDLGVFGSGDPDDVDEIDAMMANLSPTGSDILDQVIRTGERTWEQNDAGNPGDRKQDHVFSLLAVLDDMAAEAGQNPTKATGPLTEDEDGNKVSPRAGDWLEEEALIREIIRRKYGEF